MPDPCSLSLPGACPARVAWRLGIILVVLAGSPAAVCAQQVRVRSTTTGQFVQLRSLTLDTSGAWVAAGVNSAVPLTEDVELSSWGFGVPGLRAYGLFRLRGAIGSALVWPRYGDHFDALAAYVELERTRFRLRVGRQQRSSGLGLYGFDGGAVTWRPRPDVRLEAYGGRGLARGTTDPINSGAVQALDPLIPDRGTLLVGASAWAAPTAESFVSATYQREVLNDFSGVVAERVALDGQATLARRFTFAASSNVDLGAGALGKARLSVTARLPRSSSLALAVFRYRPTFDLTTIWGAFAPQASRGASVAATSPPLGDLVLTSGWTVRAYEKVTDVTPFLVDVGTTTHSYSVGAAWVHGTLAVTGDYRFITGYGGEESAGDLRVALDHGDRWRIGLNGTAFQNTEYFRVARGTVVGIGADARAGFTDRLSVSASLMRYLHTGTSGTAGPNWSQTRALFQVDLITGANPDRVAGYR